jgi:hypothetical protein
LEAARVGKFAEFGERREIKLFGFLGRDARAVEDLVFDFCVEKGLDHFLTEVFLDRINKIYRIGGRQPNLDRRDMKNMRG